MLGLVGPRCLSLTVGELLCNQLKALSKESSLLKRNFKHNRNFKHVNNKTATVLG